MPPSFFSSSVRYHQNPVVSEVNFPESFQAISTASKAVDDQRAMESSFERQSLKSGCHIQRKFGVKANTIDVAKALTDKIDMHSENAINLAMLGLNQEADGVVRPDFEMIYLAGEELVSRDFNYVTTDKLNQLKQALITCLLQFEFYVLNNKKNEFNQYLDSLKKLDHCRQVIVQIQQLVAAAKTVSGVMASIVTGADVLAQMGLADNDNVAAVFKKELPDIFGLEVKQMELKTTLNPSGSAFQIEQARESLIKKLEQYLNKRASLASKFAAGGVVSKQYDSIDRGIFYNSELQQARIVIAANLLTQLQYGHREDGVSISSPHVFAKLLMNTINANELCHKQYARSIDGSGELMGYLDSMRKEMGEIYSQPIPLKEYEVLITLREQLGLEQTDSPQFTT